MGGHFSCDGRGSFDRICNGEGICAARYFNEVSIRLPYANDCCVFPRPVWLAANRDRLSRCKPLPVVVSEVMPIWTGRGIQRNITLKFGKKKNQYEKTVCFGIMFMRAIVGARYEALVDPNRPDEFVIMPAGQINAVVFAAVGIIIEIALTMWLAV